MLAPWPRTSRAIQRRPARVRASLNPAATQHPLFDVIPCSSSTGVPVGSPPPSACRTPSGVAISWCSIATPDTASAVEGRDIRQTGRREEQVAGGLLVTGPDERRGRDR